MDYKFNPHLQMVSALGEQMEIPFWEHAVDADGNTWLWPGLHDEPGAMIHVGRVGEASQGYGGRAMLFPLLEGSITLVGPWHSNSDALFQATGVDLRDKHRTWGVIAEHIDLWTGECKDVVHVDPRVGVVGTFDRIEQLAKSRANGKQLMFYSQSRGGSHCGSVG